MPQPCGAPWNERLKSETFQPCRPNCHRLQILGSAPYRRLAETVDVEPSLPDAFERAAAFLNPVLAGQAHGQWNSQQVQWILSTG